MSALGDVLERLFARPDGSVSLHATIREWRDVERAEQVAEAMTSQLPAMKTFSPLVRLTALPARVAVGFKLRGRPDEPEGPTGSSMLEVWRDTAGRTRLERRWDSVVGPQRLVTLVLPTVNPWTLKSNDTSYDMGRNRSLRVGGRWPAPSEIDADRLFEPSLLREAIAALELAPAGETAMASRAVLEVVAKLRSGGQPSPRPWPHWMPFGADGYFLAFDVEHGHLLRIAGRSGKGVFESTEVVTIEYGLDLPEELLNQP